MTGTEFLLSMIVVVFIFAAVIFGGLKIMGYIDRLKDNPSNLILSQVVPKAYQFEFMTAFLMECRGEDDENVFPEILAKILGKRFKPEQIVIVCDGGDIVINVMKRR